MNREYGNQLLKKYEFDSISDHFDTHTSYERLWRWRFKNQIDRNDERVKSGFEGRQWWNYCLVQCITERKKVPLQT